MNNRLKAVRLDKGLSQKEISEALGIALRSWQQNELGTSIPGGRVLQLLHLKLQVNINWLLTGKGQMYFKEANVDYDRDLLSQAISMLENCLAKKDLMIDSAKKAKVAVKLFENLKRSGVQAENLAMIEREAMELLELV